jgi:bacterioferritin-associated ferredoxin
MYLCSCFGITEQQVKDLVDKGLTYEEIKEELKISSKCGVCGTYIKKFIDRQKKS